MILLACFVVLAAGAIPLTSVAGVLPLRRPSARPAAAASSSGDAIPPMVRSAPVKTKPKVKKRPAACKRPAHAPLRMLGIEELSEHAEWAKGHLRRSPDMGRRALRTLLEQEQSATAGDATMARWIKSLQAPLLNASQLKAHDAWATEVVASAPDIDCESMRRQLLEQHYVTAHYKTIQRWISRLRAAAPAAPAPILRSLRLPELATHSAWARSLLEAHPQITCKLMIGQLQKDHGVTTAR